MATQLNYIKVSIDFLISSNGKFYVWFFDLPELIHLTLIKRLA